MPRRVIDVDAALDRAAQRCERAREAHARRDLDRARRLAREAHAVFRRHAGASHPDTAATWALLGAIDLDDERFEAARVKLSRAVRDLTRLRRHRAVRPLLHRAGCDLGRALRECGRYVEARAAADLAVSISRGLDPTARVEALNERGMICKYAGWFALGARSYRRAVALLEAAPTLDRDALATLLHNQGGLEHARGRHADAERYARRGLTMRQELLGDRDAKTLADEGALAAILVDLGRLDEAAVMLRRLRAIFARRHGPRHPEVAVVRGNLAVLYARQGRLSTALAHARSAHAMVCEALGEGHPEAALSGHNLAAVLVGLGRDDEARATLDEALTVARRTLGPRHPTSRAIVDARRALGPCN